MLRHGRRPAPLVVVDGTPTAGWTVLRQVPAAQIARIPVVTGLEATTRYGTGAGGGAIIIETKR